MTVEEKIAELDEAVDQLYKVSANPELSPTARSAITQTAIRLSRRAFKLRTQRSE